MTETCGCYGAGTHRFTCKAHRSTTCTGQHDATETYCSVCGLAPSLEDIEARYGAPTAL